MAKAAKRRKKEEDDEFALPEFDEVEYMRKEIDIAKISFVVVGLAVLMALLLAALTSLLNAPIVWFFLGIGLTFLLPRAVRTLPWPKIDHAKMERKDWIGQGGVFVMSWLAFWILLLNVPFADVTNPVIASVTVNGIAITTTGQSPDFHSGTFYVNATVLENGVLRDVRFTIWGNDVPAQAIGDSRYSARTTIAATGNQPVIIEAEDAAGHTATFTFDLRVI